MPKIELAILLEADDNTTSMKTVSSELLEKVHVTTQTWNCQYDKFSWLQDLCTLWYYRFTFETPWPHRSTNQPKLGKGHVLTLWPQILTSVTWDSLLRPPDPIGARISQNWEKVIFWPCDLRFWPWWPQVHFWDPGPHKSMDQPNLETSFFYVGDVRYALEAP